MKEKDRPETVEEFYKQRFNLVSGNLKDELGHFNVFDIVEHLSPKHNNSTYRRRDFYKIKLLTGHYRYHFADKTIEINGTGLFFVNPYIPYQFELIDEVITGFMCIFTEEFFNKFGNIKDYPIYRPGGNPTFALDPDGVDGFKQIYLNMQNEIKSEYAYKYDVLRNNVFDIMHKAMKLRSGEVSLNRGSNANSRIVSLFTELLELQFPIDALDQIIKLRTAQDFANQLSVHINHLNRVVKQTTGKTTSQFIMERLHQEARALLKHTDWNISEIGYCLGFDDTSHFINTFKRAVGQTPRIFRDKYFFQLKKIDIFA